MMCEALLSLCFPHEGCRWFLFKFFSSPFVLLSKSVLGRNLQAEWREDCSLRSRKPADTFSGVIQFHNRCNRGIFQWLPDTIANQLTPPAWILWALDWGTVLGTVWSFEGMSENKMVTFTEKTETSTFDPEAFAYVPSSRRPLWFIDIVVRMALEMGWGSSMTKAWYVGVSFPFLHLANSAGLPTNFTAIQFPEPESYIRIIVAVLLHWGLGNTIMRLTSSCQWAPLTLLLVNAHTVLLLVLQVRHLADFIRFSPPLY